MKDDMIIAAKASRAPCFSLFPLPSSLFPLLSSLFSFPSSLHLRVSAVKKIRAVGMRFRPILDFAIPLLGSSAPLVLYFRTGCFTKYYAEVIHDYVRYVSGPLDDCGPGKSARR